MSNESISGILITVVIASCSGLISGKVIAVLGRRMVPYVDSEEFEGEEHEEGDIDMQPEVATSDLSA